jgi:hypothetical protein
MSSPIVNLNVVARTPMAGPNATCHLCVAAVLFAARDILLRTHSGRESVKATDNSAGSIYYESDRQSYYIAVNGVWTYLGGLYSAFQAALPTDLGTADANFLMNVTDFGHLLRWTGTGWVWGPGDAGSGYMVQFVTAPDITGWQACDGSANVLTLQSDGIIEGVTVPNNPGFYYRT